MVCKKCGASLPANSYKCFHCGTVLSKEQLMEQKNISFKEQNVFKSINKETNNISKEEHTSNIEDNSKYKYKGENKLAGYLLIGIVLILLLALAIYLTVK